MCFTYKSLCWGHVSLENGIYIIGILGTLFSMAYFTIAVVLGQFDDALKTSTLLNDIIIGLWGLSDIVLIYSIKTKKHIIFGMWILINVS